MLAIYLAVIDAEDDNNKFEFLYTTYRKLMFYVANRILNDEQLAEDAVHQTFLKILESFDKVEDVCCHKTKSYIVTIVRNTAINLYNRQRRNSSIAFEKVEFCIAEEQIERTDDLDYLTKAVMKLPVIYKDMLTLKYVQEFSNAEIAQILGISEATVRKRLERARHKLEESLKKEINADAL